MLRGLGTLAHDLASSSLRGEVETGCSRLRKIACRRPFVFYFLPIASGLSTLIGLPAAKARI